MPKTPGQRIGVLATEAIELVEARYGEGTTVGAVAIVCDVITGDEGVINPIIVLCNDPRRWCQLALLEEAAAGVALANERRIEEAEEAASDE